MASRLAALAVAAAMLPAAGAAQGTPPRPLAQWEARLDGVFGASSAGQLGVGVNVWAGDYVRTGVLVAAGPSRRDGRTAVSGRVDVVARYLLDPFGEMRWGPYVGGGFSSAWDEPTRWHGYLLAVIGLEGPARRGWRPALEVGLGGGFRAGLALRRARVNAR